MFKVPFYDYRHSGSRSLTMVRRRLFPGAFFLLLNLSMAGVALANPVVRRIEAAAPDQRIVHLLMYFDTCQSVTQDRAYAFQVLDELDAIGQEKRDERLRRYCQFLKDTYAKHDNITDTQRAELFLNVGQRAADQDDPQIAAVCQHFAGQYYFIGEEYGLAFQHLLIANKAFSTLGYNTIPEISRYLYELAFNYYYFREYKRAIHLLREAARYPPFSENFHIQTYNTLALAYARLSLRDSLNRTTYVKLAEQNYLKSQRVATQYRDSVWIGITAGNLGGLHRDQNRWAAALRAFLVDYRLGMQFGGKRYYPHLAAVSVASSYAHLDQPDSCRYYLDQATRLFQLNLATPDFARNLDDEHFLESYYAASRQYYELVGTPRLANQYADSVLAMTSHLNDRYNARQLLLADQKMLIQQHQAQVEAIESENSSRQTLFWLSLLVLALLAGLFSRLYYLSRLRRRQEREIEASNEKSLRLQKKMVEAELLQAQADLSGFVENLDKKNTLIDALTAQLESAEPTDATTTQLNETRQKLMHSHLSTKDDWDEFQRRFERVHPSFFWQLRTQFPDISPAEERLLALSQLRLDTTQMGRMLGISPESIRKTKYRLRKKHGREVDILLLDSVDE